MWASAPTSPSGNSRRRSRGLWDGMGSFGSTLRSRTARRVSSLMFPVSQPWDGRRIPLSGMGSSSRTSGSMQISPAFAGVRLTRLTSPRSPAIDEPQARSPAVFFGKSYPDFFGKSYPDLIKLLIGSDLRKVRIGTCSDLGRCVRLVLRKALNPNRIRVCCQPGFCHPGGHVLRLLFFGLLPCSSSAWRTVNGLRLHDVTAFRHAFRL